ncbi:MAG: hypothetical protein JW843_05600, partial [Candidatus Aminicenantes bacterium]|nr:hypothetical protein [Candidatus Aminicenantes bacterium]
MSKSFSRLIGLIVIFATLAAAGCSAAGSLQVENLRCEYRTDPVGIDAAQPRLSWVLVPSDPSRRALKQSAYRILASSTLSALEADRGDLWDSGKVASDRQNQVEYAGSALESARECFWKVQVWDQDGRPSAWSPAARWTMGLLKAEEWQARWIGHDAATGAPDPKAMLPAAYLRKSFPLD